MESGLRLALWILSGGAALYAFPALVGGVYHVEEPTENIDPGDGYYLLMFPLAAASFVACRGLLTPSRVRGGFVGAAVWAVSMAIGGFVSAVWGKSADVPGSIAAESNPPTDIFVDMFLLSWLVLPLSILGGVLGGWRAQRRPPVKWNPAGGARPPGLEAGSPGE